MSIFEKTLTNCNSNDNEKEDDDASSSSTAIPMLLFSPIRTRRERNMKQHPQFSSPTSSPSLSPKKTFVEPQKSKLGYRLRIDFNNKFEIAKAKALSVTMDRCDRLDREQLEMEEQVSVHLLCAAHETTPHEVITALLKAWRWEDDNYCYRFEIDGKKAYRGAAFAKDEVHAPSLYRMRPCLGSSVHIEMGEHEHHWFGEVEALVQVPVSMQGQDIMVTCTTGKRPVQSRQRAAREEEVDGDEDDSGGEEDEEAWTRSRIRTGLFY